jgi:predicted  nucleic acid-binding Zn-ribbon protein
MTPQQAAEGLSHLAKQYASVLKAAEVLKEIGSLEQRLGDLRADIAAAAAAKAELEQIKADIQSKTIARDAILAQASEAETRLQRANDDFESLKSKLRGQ